MLVLLALWLAPTWAGQPTVAGPNQLKKYVSARPPFTVYRPDTWRVQYENRPDSFRISVADAEAASSVEIYFADNRANRLNSLAALGSRVRTLKANYPDLAVSEVVACKDQSCTAATLSYTRDRIPVKGRYYVQADQQQVIIRSYSAPAARMTAMRNLMLEILANIRLGAAQAAGQPGAPVPAAPPPLQVQLVPRRAADGSVSINVPPDWTFLAQKGRTLAAAPENAPCAGFVFTVFQMLPPSIRLPMTSPDVIISPYQPPGQFVATALQRFGNRNIKALNVNPIREANAACMQQLGRGCEAALTTLNWVSPKGASCTGGFFALNSLPGMTGNWTSMVGGLWGPAQDLERYIPMLEQIGKSFSVNQQFVANYIQQGVINLREGWRKTQAAMQDLRQATADNQKGWEARQSAKDASDARWDDYRRGNSYWISDLEGGKVYATDRWGTQDTWTGDRAEGAPYNYIHFEGQNPRRPSENMREVSSYEVQQMMGGRR